MDPGGKGFSLHLQYEHASGILPRALPPSSQTREGSMVVERAQRFAVCSPRLSHTTRIKSATIEIIRETLDVQLGIPSGLRTGK